MDMHHHHLTAADAPWCRQYSPRQIITMYAHSLARAEREREQLRQELDALRKALRPRCRKGQRPVLRLVTTDQ
jgi:uncharacterized membrane protein